MLKSIRTLALIAMSIPAGVLADSSPVRSRIMWTDAPVIMDEHARGNWRREKRIWEESVYPIGNGRLGATVFGEPRMERIQFNEDSLWVGREDNAGGYRLARWALANDYGKTGFCISGPLYKESKIDGNKVRTGFDHAKGLKSRDGGPLKRFEIAGEDRKWFWADATIDGETVVVSCKDIPKPVAVRYAWASNPAGANLVNDDGLPASLFRTDDWKLMTEQQQQ